MVTFSASPLEMPATALRHKDLLIALIKREIIGRYRGSYIGIAWSFINPLFMLAVYTFVFGFIFKAKWHSGAESKIEFALALFAGLIVFNIFSECLNNAPDLITSNANYVKKVIFPIEILPLVSCASAMFHHFVSLAMWLIFFSIGVGTPTAATLLLPIIIFPLLLLTIGLSWFISSIGVYVRDLTQFIRMATTVLLYLSPVFYSVSTLPENYRHLMYLNPVTPVIEQARDALMLGKLPDPAAYAISFFVNAIIAFAGFAWFQKTRKGFADVL